tara:strand:- start:306 stop:578 length:273 start_codon:yes stop_codon:yes gene_type:complete
MSLIPGTSLLQMKDNKLNMKNRTQFANSTVEDNGTLTQEGNTTFSHTLAEDNSTILDNHTTMIQLMDNASTTANATAHDDMPTFVQLNDN